LHKSLASVGMTFRQVDSMLSKQGMHRGFARTSLWKHSILSEALLQIVSTDCFGEHLREGDKPGSLTEHPFSWLVVLGLLASLQCPTSS
jgi:hypothetical protein